MSNKLMVWFALERTGLDPSIHVPLEIAAVITDTDFNVIAQSEPIVIGVQVAEFGRMSKGCFNKHTTSGLLSRVLESFVTNADAEEQLIDFLNSHCEPHTHPLCSTRVVSDRLFLSEYMPRLLQWFHYRSIDVSTVEELARLYDPIALHSFEKKPTLRSVDRIMESIAELKHYKDNGFIGKQFQGITTPRIP